MNKKLLLSLSVLATPFVVENLVETNVASANTQYNLTQSVKVYETAQNAAKQGNTNKTYKSGTYYVYKEHNGMINISKTKGKPGSWINPATNKPVEVKNPSQNTVSSPKEQAVVKSTSQTSTPVQKQTNAYTLNNDVKVYNNAVAAKSQKGSKSTYKSGNYFIFKEFNGMLNISRVSGRAGAWINPADNKVIIAKTNPTTTQQKPTEVKSTPTKTTPVTTSTSNNNTPKPTTNNNTAQTESSTYVLKNRTSVYNNAVDAQNSKNSTADYNQGTYYVYKTHNGMINISRTRGRAGAWINPTIIGVKEEKASEPQQGLVVSSSKLPTPKKATRLPLGPTQIEYNLIRDVNVYSSAANAKNRKNPIGTLEKGTYYVYDNNRGILSIARNKKEVGYWINPKENQETPNVTLPQHLAKSMPIESKNYKITSPWAVKRSIGSIGVYDIHDGVDFVTNNRREPILATDDGVVLKAGTGNHKAERVIIKHAENSYTAYWHMAPNTITVKAGDTVKAGQKIGIMGTTGLSTGIHLHFSHGLTPDVFDTHQDPMEYLKNVK
ncbi:MAG: M23 family metallopeptidase [Gemella sp.]|nr:M23 family metallopeptidase [Gemella sp.]